MGRPRDDSLDAAILEAALAELTERGVGEFSVLRVSERAGVGRGTISRRWSTRNALIIAALGRLTPTIASPNTGNLEKDLLDICESLVVAESPERLVTYYRLGSEAQRDPELYAEFQSEVIAPIVSAIVKVIRNATQRGEIDTVPMTLIAQCLLGTIMTTAMQNQPPRPPSPALRRQLVKVLIRGMERYDET
ncbi:MAG: TetR/AcrR family transcriptional regulator [Aeromicrobium sp.]